MRFTGSSFCLELRGFCSISSHFVCKLRGGSTLTITKIMRKLRREEDVREFLATHFHDLFSIT